MESEERETSTPTAEGRDNVVPLPRDWLGPRDELVPFGPRAEDKAAPSEPAYAADDFWGEHSESLHDVVRSPATPGDDTAELATGPESQPRRRRGWAVPAALLLLALVVGAVVVGSGLRSHGAVRVRPAQASSPAVLGAGLAATDRAVSANVSQLGHRRLAVAAHRRPRPPVRHHVHHAHPVAGSGGSSSSAASTSAAQATQASSTPTYSTAPQAGSSAGSSSNGASSSGGSSSSGGGSSSSSNSQPAFGASGSLGPGSSPNG